MRITNPTAPLSHHGAGMRLLPLSTATGLEHFSTVLKGSKQDRMSSAGVIVSLFAVVKIQTGRWLVARTIAQSINAIIC
jgi:hypothetical protein